MSSSSFSVTVAKIFLVLVNLLFAFTAGNLFYFIWHMHNAPIPGDTLIFGIITWTTLSASLLVIAIALSTVSLFGLLAVLARSPTLHTLYTYLLTFWLILLGIIFFCSLLMEDLISSKGRAIFRELMGNFTYKNVDARAAVQVWQSTVHCCGLGEPANWKFQWNNVSKLEFFHYNTSTALYPASCCGLVTSWNLDNLTAWRFCSRDRLLYREGCFSPSLLSLYKLSFIAFFTILFLILFLLISVSCCLKREHCLVSEKARNTEMMTRPLLTCPHLASVQARPSAVDANGANIDDSPPPPYESIVLVESDHA